MSRAEAAARVTSFADRHEGLSDHIMRIGDTMLTVSDLRALCEPDAELTALRKLVAEIKGFAKVETPVDRKSATLRLTMELIRTKIAAYEETRS